MASDSVLSGVGLGRPSRLLQYCTPLGVRAITPGLLARSASTPKSSRWRGYRAGFVAGDSDLVACWPCASARRDRDADPVQAAMVAALDDDEHEKVRRERYAQRRAGAAAGAAGRRDSRWIIRRQVCICVGQPWPGLPGRRSGGSPNAASWVAPGDFAARHVRVALTATGEQNQRRRRPPELAFLPRADAKSRPVRRGVYVSPVMRGCRLASPAGKSVSRLPDPLTLGDVLKRVFPEQPIDPASAAGRRRYPAGGRPRCLMPDAIFVELLRARRSGP